MYFTFDLIKKMEKQKRQLMFLTKQNNKIKKSLKENYEEKVKKDKEAIQIKYVPVKCKKGIVNKDTELHIAPIDNAEILDSIPSGRNIEIVDSGEINGVFWYEIVTDLNKDVNNKGWVPAADLILQEDIIEP